MKRRWSNRRGRNRGSCKHRD